MRLSDEVVDLFGGPDRPPEKRPAPVRERPKRPRKAKKDRYTLPLFPQTGS
jgi:hypothetical protein